MDWKTVQIKALCLLFICLQHFYFLNPAMLIFFMRHFSSALYILIFPFSGVPWRSWNTLPSGWGSRGTGQFCTFSAADSSTRWEREGKTHCTETKHPYTSLSPAWVFPWASRPSLLQEKTLRIDKQRSISSLNTAGNTIDKEGSSKTQTHKIVCPGIQ